MVVTTWGVVQVAGVEVVVAAYGWTGESAFQLFAPPAAAEAATPEE